MQGDSPFSIKSGSGFVEEYNISVGRQGKSQAKPELLSC